MVSKTTAVVAGLVIVVLAACVTALAWHGTVDGQAAMTYFGSLSLAGVIGGAAQLGMKSGASAAANAILAAQAPRSTGATTATARRARTTAARK